MFIVVKTSNFPCLAPQNTTKHFVLSWFGREELDTQRQLHLGKPPLENTHLLPIISMILKPTLVHFGLSGETFTNEGGQPCSLTKGEQRLCFWNPKALRGVLVCLVSFPDLLQF